jgi:hypothetical protein
MRGLRFKVPLLVIAGPDPATHPFARLFRRLMDARVKPAHDTEYAALAWLYPPRISKVGQMMLGQPNRPPLPTSLAQIPAP